MNQVVLIGNVAKVGDLKETSNGKVIEIRLAVPKGRKKDDGAEFFSLEAWDAIAEVIANHAPVGRQIGVSGRLAQDEWTTDAGEPRSRVKVKVRELDLLGSPKPKGDGETSGDDAAEDFTPIVTTVAENDDIPF